MGSSSSCRSNRTRHSRSPPSKEQVDRHTNTTNTNTNTNTNTKQRGCVRNPPSDSLPILLPARHSFRVNLFLVDVSKQVRDDPDGSHLRHCCMQTTKTKEAGGNSCWETACSSATFLKQAADNDSDDNDNEPPTTPNEVQRQVLRFFKTNDKYLAYVSMLFKSRAFHEVYNDKLLVELSLRLAMPKQHEHEHEHGGGEHDEQKEDSNNNNNGYNNVQHPGVGRTVRNERPIVDLPRTEYRKPYIPLPKNWRTKAQTQTQTQTQERITGNAPTDEQHRTMVKEEDIFSLSISHHFPFVGMAEITTATTTTRREEDPAARRNGHRYDVSSKHKHSDLIPTGTATTTTTTTAATTTTNETVALTTLLQDRLPPPIVGLDIVVFDELNPRLYSSAEEFLEAFRDQFTENEWKNGIQNPKLVAAATTTATATSTISATPKMKEFYLRWAMKEAYTKALGVGMGLEFNTFEIHLEEIDDDASACKETSLLDRIMQATHGRESSLSSTSTSTTSPNSNCKCFRGRVQFTNQRSDEYFCFYFLPLTSSNYAAEVAAQATKPTPIVVEGCACVCVGSFRGGCVLDDNDVEWRNCINTSWTDIETLVQFHRWKQS